MDKWSYMDAKWTTKESIWKHMDNVKKLYGIQLTLIDTYEQNGHY
jgi:hypothetical protein